jgi:hypothetical protein
VVARREGRGATAGVIPQITSTAINVIDQKKAIVT